MIVEFDPDSEPISGTVSGARIARPFIGWMQLVTALQAAIDDAARQGPPEPVKSIEGLRAER